MWSELKWLIVIQLLLNEQALCRVPPSLVQRHKHLPKPDIHKYAKKTEVQKDHQFTLGSRPQSKLPSGPRPEDNTVRSAQQIVSVLKKKLERKMEDQLHLHRNVSCEELLSASTMDDGLHSTFPQELLALSMAPVLVVVGCPREAQTLVQKLYGLIGVHDADDLLLEVEHLIELRLRKTAPTSQTGGAGSHMDAVMFNIQRLAEVDQQEERCEGWTRMNGSALVGPAMGGASRVLEEAVSVCERLGPLCAGVAQLHPGRYQAVLRKDSRIFPSSKMECWILQCNANEKLSESRGRMKRSPGRSCINRREERVYKVMEWIPAVSTLYNLGTAVYYASVNCSATAKERAILSAVDLGTDALMVVTGGTAGVAGYAVGAGVKTGVKAGVKYLLNSMKEEEDVLVNQFSWDDSVITIQ